MSTIATAGVTLMMQRRFPAPWSVEDIGAAFVVKDSAGQQLAYVSPASGHPSPIANDGLSHPSPIEFRVDNVDNFPQGSAAIAETTPYFFCELLNELGSLIFTTY